MRTLVLLGVAAGSLLLAGHARAEQPSLDYGNPDDPDARVYTGYPDRVPSEVEYRRVAGYDAEGRWTGTWDGTYETPDGRRYEGRYEGSVEGHGAGYPPRPLMILIIAAGMTRVTTPKWNAAVAGGAQWAARLSAGSWGASPATALPDAAIAPRAR